MNDPLINRRVAIFSGSGEDYRELLAQLSVGQQEMKALVGANKVNSPAWSYTTVRDNRATSTPVQHKLVVFTIQISLHTCIHVYYKAEGHSLDESEDEQTFIAGIPPLVEGDDESTIIPR